MPRRNRPDSAPVPGLAAPSAASGEPFGPELELWQGGAVVIGIDEAGRGPLAGPVVAAAVSFSPEVRIAGIGDSKTRSVSLRNELEPLIKAHASAWAVAESSPERIDEINILQATREAMQKAIASVIEQLGTEWPVLLVDGRIPEIPLGKHINVIKGDSISFSIGAASILAKVHRDHLMREHDRKWPQYGFARHKGYPTLQHREALFQHGPCPLHRLSFTLESGGSRKPISDLNGGVKDER